mmetsp:Transcript_27028/g.36120  ORF Transcript_27028/g.36120 Transcript_27028/m.36120 type:complete len:116 (+) Transcript_27028:260-607(+)
MNLLQFLIFMLTWNIRLPATTKIIIGELKSLAFCEFMPTGWFKDSVRSAIGIETPQTKCGDQPAGVCEESGSARLGTNDLVENSGAMLLASFMLVMILALLLLLRFLTTRWQRGR